MAISIDYTTLVIMVPQEDLTPLPDITLADASAFSVGDQVTGDGDNGNDGVGIVESKSGNTIRVRTSSGSWVTGNGVDNANPYVSDETTISNVNSVFYELDVNWFRLQLKALESDDNHMPYPDTHRHNTEVILAGVTYARTFEIINGYAVEFEDGQYVVNCVGANHNLADVKVANQTSLIINNTGGLIVSSTGVSGLTTSESNALLQILAYEILGDKMRRNRRITDPDTGQIIFYDDDDVTPLVSGPLWEDKNETIPYKGEGAEARGRLT